MDIPTQRRTSCVAALLSAFICYPALAQPVDARLSYAAYFGALNAADINADIAISAQGYRLQLSYRLTGVVGAMVHGDGTSTVDGRFQGDAATPRELVSTGQFRGRPHAMRMEWRGGSPAVTLSEPPDKEERDPVPAAQQAHTIDSLSAMAWLLRQVAATGRCDGTLRTFDGRRLAELRARTVGEEVLPETSRSTFKGTALRCDFEGRQLAGFSREGDQAELRRPHEGTAWFARVVPGGPSVPVRITFGARTFGETTMYLTGQPAG